MLLAREAHWHCLWLDTACPDLVPLRKGTSLPHPEVSDRHGWCGREGLPSPGAPLPSSGDTIPEEQLRVSWVSVVLFSCAGCHQAATKRFFMTDLMTQHVQHRLRALTFPTPCLRGWDLPTLYPWRLGTSAESGVYLCPPPLLTEVLRPKEARKAARMMQGLRKMG